MQWEHERGAELEACMQEKTLCLSQPALHAGYQSAKRSGSLSCTSASDRNMVEQKEGNNTSHHHDTGAIPLMVSATAFPDGPPSTDAATSAEGRLSGCCGPSRVEPMLPFCFLFTDVSIAALAVESSVRLIPRPSQCSLVCGHSRATPHFAARWVQTSGTNLQGSQGSQPHGCEQSR
jgi:hypothetical protein